MAGNNVKLLTDRQLTELNRKYSFFVDENEIIVKVNDYNRKTRHPIDKSFSINSKIRKITISAEAISIWLELSKGGSYSLFAIQNAVNKLYLTYQNITLLNVKKILSGTITKITEI